MSLVSFGFHGKRLTGQLFGQCPVAVEKLFALGIRIRAVGNVYRSLEAAGYSFFFLNVLNAKKKRVVHYIS